MGASVTNASKPATSPARNAGVEHPRAGCPHPPRERGGRSRTLDEGAVTRDRLPDNECIHLARPFVGIDRLCIRHKASDVLVQEDAVAAK